MEVYLRLLDVNQDILLDEFPENERNEIIHKSINEMLLVNRKTYVLIRRTGDGRKTYLWLDLVASTECVVTEDNKITQRSFKKGDRVFVANVPRADYIQFNSQTGTVIDEFEPQIPLERRKIGEFVFVTLVKVKFDSGEVADLPNTILEFDK